MTPETDAVEAFRMVLKQLAKDPRVSIFPNLRTAATLLDVAFAELAQRQAEIALAVLQLNEACRFPISGGSPLRDRLERIAYGAELPRVHADD